MRVRGAGRVGRRRWEEDQDHDPSCKGLALNRWVGGRTAEHTKNEYLRDGVHAGISVEKGRKEGAGRPPPSTINSSSSSGESIAEEPSQKQGSLSTGSSSSDRPPRPRPVPPPPPPPPHHRHPLHGNHLNSTGNTSQAQN